MKWAQFAISTLRDKPKEAESKSHKLLLKGGYIYKLFSGIYLYTPLGWRVLNKIINIVREEMNKAGALEVYLSVLQPESIWKESGRLYDFGPLMYKLKDRQDNTLIIGPTHEEPITLLAKYMFKTYRDLPKTLYQIQVKFRDELRPRFGPIRAREFIMKDAYSFDLTEEGLNKSYEKMSVAYNNIFTRLKLNYVCVDAESGLMGGSQSQEFISLSEYGEDTIVKCPSCHYKANIHIAKSYPATSNNNDKDSPLEYVYTPNVKTLEQVSRFLNVKEEGIIKTLIYTDENNNIFVFCIRGDRELNLSKACLITKSLQLQPASREVIEKLTTAEVGYSGPYGLDRQIFVDHNIVDNKFYVAGANKTNYHMRNFNVQRDLKNYQICDLTTAKEGDLCLNCKTKLEFLVGIEVGHIFKLGTKYSDKFGFKLLREDGKLSDVIMGCYGIGVSRLMSAVVECLSTDDAILWPWEIAPFEIEIITVNMNDEESLKCSSQIYSKLISHNYEVLWDDRNESAGVKFNDADLIGAPLNIIVGKKFTENKKIEVRDKINKQTHFLTANQTVRFIREFSKSIIESNQ
ncbi:MAG: proline--tRNA ligase [Planctomycetota bacterium]